MSSHFNRSYYAINVTYWLIDIRNNKQIVPNIILSIYFILTD